MNRKKRKIIFVLLFIAVIFSASLIIISPGKYKYPPETEITKRVNFLDKSLCNKFDTLQISILKNKISDIETKKRINYLERKLCNSFENSGVSQISNNKEWLLFSYAYTTYALTNIAVRNSSTDLRSKQMMKFMIEKVLQSELCSGFGVDSATITNNKTPAYSVLYLGHLNLMLGCYRLTSDDTCFNSLNNRISESLFRRFSESESMNLESYPGSIWVSDNTVALASLKMHSYNTGSNYQDICCKWVDFMKEKYVDKSTGLLYSTINPQTGEPEEEPRGSMTGWNIIFISRFDKAFAVEQYNNYLTHFSDNYITFRLFKERSGNSETSYGDIDSGPLFAGYGIPSNVFVLACAVIAGDYKTAGQIEALINIGAKKIDKNDEIYYKVRFVDMDISPMAEAIVLFSMTVGDWTE